MREQGRSTCSQHNIKQVNMKQVNMKQVNMKQGNLKKKVALSIKKTLRRVESRSRRADILLIIHGGTPNEPNTDYPKSGR
jgi:hypothetical protein